MKKLRRWVRDVSRRLAGRDVRSERSRGDERRNVGDWTMAAHHYRAYLKRHPRDFGIWVQLGHALKEAKLLDQADAAYRAADKLDPANADLLLSRGHLAKLRGALDDAADLYSRSFALDSNPDAARELGQLSVRPAPPAPPPLARLTGVVDGFGEGTVVGWAVDSFDSNAIAEVEVFVDGKRVASGLADIERDDLVAAGLTSHPAGFAIDLSGCVDLSETSSISVRIAGGGVDLAGSPLKAEVASEAKRWAKRWAKASEAAVEAITSRLPSPSGSERVSFIVLLDEREPHLPDLIASLEAQWCDRWNAVLVPKRSAAPKLTRAPHKRLTTSDRVRVLEPGSRLESAVVQAGGEIVCVIPASSVLEPQAVWRILDAASGEVDVVYWDEARIWKDADAVERFVLRPCLGIDNVERAPEMIGTVAMRRALAEQVLGSAIHVESIEIGRRALSMCRRAAHVPSVLERRRTRVTAAENGRDEPTGLSPSPKRRALIILDPTVPQAEVRSVVEAILKATPRGSTDLLVLCRETRPASLERYLQRLPKSIFVATCRDDEPAAHAINTAVAARADAYDDFVFATRALFPSGDWLSKLLRHLAQEEVGAAAPILVDPRGVIVSAGVTLADGALRRRYAGVPLRLGGRRSKGWNGGLISVRRDAAAEGCVAVRADRFTEVGGLDPFVAESMMLPDLCLRLGQAGFSVLIDPDSPVTVEATEASAPDPFFKVRWRELASGDDRFWHPSLTTAGSLTSPDDTFAPARVHDVVRPAAMPMPAGRA